jgi:predicted alpha/beta-hydrolase family hydrolase
MSRRVTGPVEVPEGSVTALHYRANERAPAPTLILGHGAGAGQRSPFISATARALAELGVDVITFNFPYVEQGRRLPDRRPVLESCYRAVMRAAGTPAHGLFIGGKSMGGRIATHVAAADPACPVKGIVLLGYPLHPPGRADERRDAHLTDIHCPLLFVQGSRDAFGTPGELAPVLSRLIVPPALHVVAGGDHSFKIARASPAAQSAALDKVYRTVADWIRRAGAAEPANS